MTLETWWGDVGFCLHNSRAILWPELTNLNVECLMILTSMTNDILFFLFFQMVTKINPDGVQVL